MGRKPKNQTKRNSKEIPKKNDNKVIARLRGMRDMLPEEHQYYRLVVNKSEEIIKYYGFSQTDIPALENLSLYERSTGKQTDVVSKEMYTFIDKDGDRVGIRPEATPGLVRSYIEHGMFNQPIQPVKLYWIGNLMRREKPQSGRYRQFSQIDLEIFGEAGPVADAQIILIANRIFKDLQIDVQVQINSIGCKECRPAYVDKLAEYYKQRQVRNKLCQDCKKRMLKNPLRLLDCKEESCREARAEAPQIVDHLCEECRDHFVKVLEYLDELDVIYNLNPFLVRGLDYYNRTVFEFWPEENENARQNALGGGGRYDDLVEYMGGRPTPALGWGLGVERIILKIKENNIPLADDGKPDIFLAQLGEASKRKAMIFFEELRKKKYKAAQNFVKDNLKSQLELADKLGVKLTLIIGQKEMMDETVIIRDMESGMQEVFDFKKVYEELDKRLK
ncbi:histidine--tRNA ligase [Candidatus Falkowbacteria bacterium CG10_big_fil_rev_8_21_14_0_10_43_10]|uniref:Histidine--tRNA ligase n=1 Tax=Candidatus Falkowbacteria bacterium CG10_big_fil_rev_8_21_14_0_10_43_10 TaxID=1974567 RepID=A0A2H0V418_9BACT|nr:MAG: histidine--tRNA ligase [Candidatus Falkowbacteria bacterium CG10_big_fil_rev_8_21_14_0_10_43_10]